MTTVMANGADIVPVMAAVVVEALLMNASSISRIVGMPLPSVYHLLLFPLVFVTTGAKTTCKTD